MIERVLHVVLAAMTPWQIAFRFVSETYRLGQRRPWILLGSNPDGVVIAAERERNGIVG